jgi:high affinity Mn2+ porin
MTTFRNARIGIAFAIAALSFVAITARAQDATPGPSDASETWSLHGQVTFIDQYHPAFRSAFSGANSLDPGSRGDETFEATLFAGVRLWDGGEAYANSDIDQGFGLSQTYGVAAFPNGGAYKLGAVYPYFRLHRLFFRQTFDLGGDVVPIQDGANQVSGETTSDNLVITAGKFAVVDIFDTNSYAHDPTSDFLNWCIIDSCGYDYAADAWGFTYGGAAEWTQSWWTLRAGLFDLSRIPNHTALVRGFGEYEIVSELEARHTWWRRDGKLKLLGYVNRGKMGSYNDAVALAIATGSAPNTALVRRGADRPGIALTGEQQISDDLGAFARISMNDGSEEAFEFTDVDRSAAAGLSLQGSQWQRPEDVVGFAVVADGISRAAQRYLALGGLGILIGDGALPHPGTEMVLETYYKATLADWFAVTADYQFVANPAYNQDRGPVSILGIRLHAQI